MFNPRIIKPERLRKGDTIGIVAPASSFDPGNFKRGVKMLRKMGYRVKYEHSILSRYWSKSGHEKERAEQINRMFADKNVKAIFCANAGEGSTEILPYLDKKIIRENPKIFVGYSDITILLLYLQKIADMVVFHGPVVADEIYDHMNQATLDYLLRTFSQTSPIGPVMFPQLVPLKPGKAQGILMGGNITLIMKAIDTSYEMPTENKILFLEDINEKPNTIRDYFLNMERIGMFKKVRGLLLGKMVNCFKDKKSFQEMLKEIFHDYKFPIIFGFPSGHKRRRNGAQITLPLGILATIDADAAVLRIDESAVR